MCAFPVRYRKLQTELAQTSRIALGTLLERGCWNGGCPSGRPMISSVMEGGWSGFTVQSAQLGYRPKNPVTLGAAERTEVEAFLEAVDADDDVQNVYAGLAG